MTDDLRLTDEQIRKFLADGYLVLQPDLPDSLHETVYQNLLERVPHNVRGNPGNNLLACVPQMRHVLHCPVVRGALTSVLGEGWFEHPHRYCHVLEPASVSGQHVDVAADCHQDSYTPLGRPLIHYPRYVRLMYYPQDTPIELGPTHIIPGTQYHSALTDDDRHRAAPCTGAAGTVILTHFDLGHAKGDNVADKLRFMVKFIFVRASQPTAPTWNCDSDQWQRPCDVESQYDHELVWSHHWDWICGKRDRYQSARSRPDLAVSSDAIDDMVGQLADGDPAERTRATYALGLIGDSAIAPLCATLREAGRRKDHQPDDADWNTTIRMRPAAHALAGMGAPAVTPLIELLDDDSNWVRINAAFALGEMDAAAAAAVPDLIRCLADDCDRVVRTAADALGQIGRTAQAATPALAQLLRQRRGEWSVPQNNRPWSSGEMVRANAAMALARLAAADAEPDLIDALDDPCGHVGIYAMHALRRLDTPGAARAVGQYLAANRWDSSIDPQHPF